MTETSRQQQLKKLALITTATIAATISVAGCSTSTPDAGPTTTAVSKPGPTSSSAPAGSCEVDPSSAPTADRFDAATENWIKLEHPVMGTGMDYLGGFTDVQELPKGKAVTLRYRVALDASMIDGKGGVEATAVLPDPLVQIGTCPSPSRKSRLRRTDHDQMCCRSTPLPTRGTSR
jgi:hypothetical protein